MVTWEMGLYSRLVFHSPMEFFIKVFRVRLIVYSSYPSTLSCYEALIHRLTVAIPGSAQIVFFCLFSFSAVSIDCPVIQSLDLHILGAFCAPLMYLDMCPILAIMMPDRSSRLYWGRIFIGWSLDVIELLCGSFGITIFFSSLGGSAFILLSCNGYG